MRNTNRAFVVVPILVALTGCSEPLPAAPIDPPAEPGPFGVGHTVLTAIDGDRDDRSLLIDIWYPVDEEDLHAEGSHTAYPLAPFIDLESTLAFDDLPVSSRSGARTLLVFSHGYGGINTQSITLVETLASHGFVVASPEHTGNAQSSMTDTFDEAASRRVPDVSFVIDTMLERSREASDPFHERLDGTQVGVVGHSFGGMTAIGSAAGWADAAPDPRVAAIAPISAVIDGDLQGDTRTSPNAGFTAEQLATVEVPVLLLGGTEDESVPVENNHIAFEQLINAPVVYDVAVVGANHTHFANVCDIGNLLIELGFDQESWAIMGAEPLVEPYEATCSEDAFPIEEAVRLQSLYVVSFFRRHLLGHAGYDRYLSAAHAAEVPSIVFASR